MFGNCVHVRACRCQMFVWVCVWLCQNYPNLVMPHQCACIRRELKRALWLACGSCKPVLYTLDWVGKKKKNSIVFVRVMHEPKPQRVLSPPVLYVKQFKWCKLQESLFFFLSFPRVNLLGKEIEVSSSVSKRGVFSWNCLLFWICRLICSPSDSLQRN